LGNDFHIENAFELIMEGPYADLGFNSEKLQIRMPPFTENTWPDIQAACGEHR
jgi:hypothetical protein